MDHVKVIARKIARRNRRQIGLPRVVIDASLQERKGPGRAILVIGIFKAAGFDVQVVLDPSDVRHHSKIAYIERVGKRERARLEAHSARCEAKRVTYDLNKEDTTNAERLELQKKLNKLHSVAKSKEKAAQGASLSPTFAEDLKHAINRLPDHDSGSKVSTLTGRFQADAVIADLIVSGETDIVFSSDADFSFLGGSKCLQIHDYKLQKGSLVDITIQTPSKATIEIAVEAANGVQSAGKQLQWKAPKYPLLDGVDDPYLRCAIGVVMGCDTFVGGLKGYGPSKIDKLLKELTNPSAKDFLGKALVDARSSIDIECLWTAVLAMIYEPSCAREEDNDNGEGDNGDGKDDRRYRYTFKKPTAALPYYIKEFVADDDGYYLQNEHCATCHGHSSMESHLYLQNFGQACSTCKVTCCQFCMVSTDKNKTFECLKCLGGDVPDELSADQLRQELVDHHYKVAADATFSELQEIHDAVVTQRLLSNSDDSSQKYPLFKSSVLHKNTVPGESSALFGESYDVLDHSIGEHLYRFYFKEGGSFLQDTKVTAEVVVGVATLFASTIRFSDEYVRDKKGTHYGISNCLPDMVNKFAEGSRAAGGERLKKRALRTAYDTKTKQLDEKASAAVFRSTNGNIGLLISHTVSPSFRTDTEYKVRVAFTGQDLIAAECNCQAGCKEDDRHICVHILPVILQLAMLLFDGLAENFLVELCQRWPSLQMLKLLSRF